MWHGITFPISNVWNKYKFLKYLKVKTDEFKTESAQNIHLTYRQQTYMYKKSTGINPNALLGEDKKQT